MKTRFDTTDFKRSHGKAPRGEGVWAFAPNDRETWEFSPCMTYTEAKEWARETFPEATEFMVGP